MTVTSCVLQRLKCYDHFHSIKLHSAYLSQILWYKRYLFCIPYVLFVANVLKEMTIYTRPKLPLNRRKTESNSYAMVFVSRSSILFCNPFLLLLNPFPSSMQSTFSKHSSNSSLLSAILNFYDENLTSLLIDRSLANGLQAFAGERATHEKYQ